MSAARTRLARRRRGTASVEVVIALPVLIIVLAGVMFMFRRSVEHHGALQRARACAWDYALHACSRGDAPLCASTNAELGDDLPREPGVFDTISDIPLLGSAVDGLFGKAASAGSEWSTSGFMAPDQRIGGTTVRTLVCAPSAEPLGERVKGALCDFIKDKLGFDKMYGCS